MMMNQEQLEAASAEFKDIWNRSLAERFKGDHEIKTSAHAELIYACCWQSFLHGLRWIGMPELKQ